MVKLLARLLLLPPVAFALLAQAPHVEISNRTIHAKVYLPDAQRGYYRGTRFDWSGVVATLEYQRHDYFGVWFPKYDPTSHDAITGPVEEFRGADGALGYAEAKPGELFVKIGVGILQKPDNTEYQFFRTYKLVSSGVWAIRPYPDRVEFEQEIKPVRGYAYDYTKKVRLAHGKPELILEHTLRNTGKRTIETDVYDHDFFVIDAQPTGPAFRIHFPFAPHAEKPLGNAAAIEGDDVVYKHELEPDEKETVSGYLTGFTQSAKQNDIRVENNKVGAGVEEIGSRPISKLFLWSIRTTICPEAYISLKVAPGESAKWQIRYRFYTFPPEPSQRTPSSR